MATIKAWKINPEYFIIPHKISRILFYILWNCSNEKQLTLFVCLTVRNIEQSLVTDWNGSQRKLARVTINGVYEKTLII